jgi:hypothetical protein
MTATSVREMLAGALPAASAKEDLEQQLELASSGELAAMRALTKVMFTAPGHKSPHKKQSLEAARFWPDDYGIYVAFLDQPPEEALGYHES